MSKRKRYFLIGLAVIGLILSSVACNDPKEDGGRGNATEAFELLDKGQRTIQDTVESAETFVNGIGE